MEFGHSRWAAIGALIGDEATSLIRQAIAFRLWASVAGIAALPMTVAAKQGDSHALGVLSICAWLVAVGVAVVSVARSRRGARLAAAHLSIELGFSVSPAAFATRRGWDTYIREQQYWHDRGEKRPFVYVSTASSRAKRYGQ